MERAILPVSSGLADPISVSGADTTVVGFQDGNDGSGIHPAIGRALGRDQDPKKGDTNAPLQWPILLAPIPLPLDNLWSEDAQVGSILMYRQLSQQIITHLPMGITPSKMQNFVGASALEGMCIERVNYVMGLEAKKDPTYSKTLLDYAEEYRVGGRLTNPLTNPIVAQRTKRPKLSDYKSAALMIKGQTKIYNVWGNHVSGDHNCHLFYLLIFVPVEQETVYHTSVKGDEARILDDKLVIEDDLMRKIRTSGHPDIVKRQRLLYKPEYVAVADSDKVLSRHKRLFTVRGPNNEEWEGEGIPTYIGRCIGNPRFDRNTIKEDIPYTLCRNMQKSMLRGQIDVLLCIKEHLQC
jgi:hypothetical protein